MYNVIEVKNTEYGKIRILHQYDTDIVFLTNKWGRNQGAIDLNDKDKVLFSYNEYMVENIIKENMKKVLFLGGGSCILPRYINKMGYDIKIDIIEINEHMIKMAKKHFNFEEKGNNEVYIQDARIFVENVYKDYEWKNTDNSEKYDFILQDVFNENMIIPKQFSEKEYYKQIKGILKNEGIFVINYVGGNKDIRLKKIIENLRNDFVRVEIKATGRSSNMVLKREILILAYKC